MKQNSQTTTDNEPIGIVISRGSQVEEPPRFWAYVWGQFEEPETSEVLVGRTG